MNDYKISPELGAYLDKRNAEASELIALRAGVERLKEALTPFACSCLPGVCGQDNEHSPGVVCHARRAREILGPYEGMPRAAPKRLIAAAGVEELSAEAIRTFVERLKAAPLSAFDPAVDAGWEAPIAGDEEKERKRGRYLFGAMLDSVIAYLYPAEQPENKDPSNV